MGIQLFMPTFEVEECLKEIRECLEKGWTGLGYKTVEFEEKWKEYTELEHAYYVNSATAGLYLTFDILKEEKYKDGGEIITTPLTFISTNHAILKAGFKPVFADVDDTLCLDPMSVESKITKNTKAICFVGIGGNAGHYKEIVDICKKHKLGLVLDAAHMGGTRYKDGTMPGKEADAVIYSFQAVKNLPTADSGMVCFKEKKYDEIARKKGWLGINKDTYLRTNEGGTYKWRYDVEYVGDKYHGNSVIASIGIVQLKYLDRDNAYRKMLAKWYRDGFSRCKKIKLVNIPEECDSSCHLFQIIVDKRDEVMLALNQLEIYPGVHYVDNTEYNMYAYAANSCPKAHYYSEHVISLPMHLRLAYADIKKIVEEVIKVVE